MARIKGQGLRPLLRKMGPDAVGDLPGSGKMAQTQIDFDGWTRTPEGAAGAAPGSGRRPKLPLLGVVALGGVLCLHTACMSWTRGWELGVPEAVPAQVTATLEATRTTALEADSRDRLLAAIARYQEVLAMAPGNLEALSRLSEYHCLLGAAYSQRRRNKADAYIQAIQYAERAMSTNPQFRQAIERGQSLPEAAAALTLDEMDAMHFWVTGVSYYFKECLNPIRYPFNMTWMSRSTQVLERMGELDADWSQGAVHFAWGIYYLALPKFAGGDMEKSAENLQRTLAVAPESLLGRWGRAKYFHVKTKNRQGFEDDLRWVLEQDPRAAASPYPWNVYFQRDAKRMLDEVDRYF